MAAVLFKYVTAEARKFSGNDHSSGHKRKMFDEFLTGKGWHFIGNQAFHSEPSFGTVREQMVSQARAIWDIEELLKWKPTLKGLSQGFPGNRRSRLRYQLTDGKQQCQKTDKKRRR